MELLETDAVFREKRREPSASLRGERETHLRRSLPRRRGNLLQACVDERLP